MAVFVPRHNPSEAQFLDVNDAISALGFEPVQVRNTAAVACGLAAVALAFVAVRQYRKG